MEIEENPIITQSIQGLYLGNYQSVLNKLLSDEISKTRSLNMNEVRILIMRAYLCQGKIQSALREVAKIEPADDLASVAKNLVFLYERMSEGASKPISSDEKVVKIVENTEQLASNRLNFTKPTFIVLASLIFLHSGCFEKAMRLFYLYFKTVYFLVNSFALMVQTYLLINRVDMAQELLETSKPLFEENPIYHLAESWTFLFLDGKYPEKAFYSFEELGTSNSSVTVKLLNSQASAKMNMNQNSEVENILLEAQEKDATNSDTLANMVISSAQNGKESYSHLLSQLEEQSPAHPFLIDMEEKAELFDNLCQKYSESSTA
ncbi:hypothetical protein BB560_002430 [Smittium megazygosporum]|uniref:Coatomer subunit epsilon n=1 Tax=Smittium megazygosporum TaxID=133381 RepID=A0A2T9ZEW8_9FUNG|nr:hypothetical protein BB560_002430 [Smittium megazygosporum]